MSPCFDRIAPSVTVQGVAKAFSREQLKLESVIANVLFDTHLEATISVSPYLKPNIHPVARR